MKFLFYSLFLLTSCSKLQDKTEATGIPMEILPLEINQIFKNKTLSDLIEVQEIIPLHGLQSSDLLSTIDKTIFFDKKIYVLDRNFSKLCVFDSLGKYITTIGELGEAPGQYQNINDFLIDRKRKIIVLYSNDSMSMFTYDLFGKFIERVKLPFFAYSFTQLDNESYLFYANFNTTDKRYNIYQTNLKGEIIRKQFPYTKKQNVGIGFSGFLTPSCIENTNNLSIGLTDTVFQLSKNKVETKYYFNFNDKTLENNTRFDHNSFFRNGLDYSILRSNFIETEDICFYDYQHKRVINFGFFFKDGLINYNFNKQKHEDFLEKIINIPVGTMINNTFVSFLTPENIVFFLEKNPTEFTKLKNKQPFLYEKIKNYRDNLSPILVTFNIHIPKTE